MRICRARWAAFAADRLMALEVEGLCGAGHGARGAERLNHRNRYRDRIRETRAGAIDLGTPKLRKGKLSSLFPGAPAQRGEGAGRGDPGGLCAGKAQ